MALFESYERRIDKINSVLNSYGIASIEEAEKITKDAGLNVYDQIKGIQPICFENACWAYTVGAAIAIKKGCRRAADAAAAIGEGLQAFCTVAEQIGSTAVRSLVDGQAQHDRGQRKRQCDKCGADIAAHQSSPKQAVSSIIAVILILYYPIMDYYNTDRGCCHPNICSVQHSAGFCRFIAGLGPALHDNLPNGSYLCCIIICSVSFSSTLTDYLL